MTSRIEVMPGEDWIADIPNGVFQFGPAGRQSVSIERIDPELPGFVLVAIPEEHRHVSPDNGTRWMSLDWLVERVPSEAT